MKTLKTWAAAAAMVALTGTAQAALVSQGDGTTVLDTNTNLIWLQDWNVNGQKNWGTQKAWAETTLDGFAGSNDWRLPEISEYAALFGAYGPPTALTVFRNVQLGSYWSGTAIASLSSNIFNTSNGNVDSRNHDFPFSAVAVRAGNVTASVPEPQTLALVLLALGATVVARRTRSC